MIRAMEDFMYFINFNKSIMRTNGSDVLNNLHNMYQFEPFKSNNYDLYILGSRS